MQLKEQLMYLSSQVERVIHEPDVTTKKGRLKSRKSRQGPPPTTDDLTRLEVLDEVNKKSKTKVFKSLSQSIFTWKLYH